LKKKKASPGNARRCEIFNTAFASLAFQPFKDSLPEALSRGPEVLLLAQLVASTNLYDLFVGKGACPLNLIVRDPVVRFTRNAPAPDRRTQCHSPCLGRQAPSVGLQRRNHLVSASTAAKVHRRSIFFRYVKQPVLEVARNELDKFGTNAINPTQEKAHPR